MTILKDCCTCCTPETVPAPVPVATVAPVPAAPLLQPVAPPVCPFCTLLLQLFTILLLRESYNFAPFEGFSPVAFSPPGQWLYGFLTY